MCLAVCESVKMPKNCAAVGCTNHNMMAHKKLSFCIFPNKKKQPERWRKWVKALNRVNHDGSDWQPGGKYVYLCSEHFLTGTLRRVWDVSGVVVWGMTKGLGVHFSAT